MIAEYSIVTAGDALHDVAFAYASQQFKKFFNAELKTAAYRYAIATNRQKQPKAVLAIRHLGEIERTLTELYMQCTAQDWLLEKHGLAIDRNFLVEVGSLACDSANDAVGLLKFAVIYGELIGLRYTFLTATKPVRLLMRKIGFEFTIACVADAAMAREFSNDCWGSYYSKANSPKVCLLQTRQLYEQSRPWFQQQGRAIAKLAMTLPTSLACTPSS